jgi:hypothetical protein
MFHPICFAGAVIGGAILAAVLITFYERRLRAARSEAVTWERKYTCLQGSYRILEERQLNRGPRYGGPDN